jgi:peroxiredoxin
VAKIGVGDAAPEFELEGSDGETHRLEDLRGRWVVLAFYPGDFTPICTTDHRAARAYGVVVPGGLVRRSVFIVGPDAIVRYRHVAMLGPHYKDVEHLAGALSLARAA